MPKLSTTEINNSIPDVIRDAIHAHLRKNNPFTNDSLAYVGVKFRYMLDITFLARNEESTLQVVGNGKQIAEGEREADAEELPEMELAGDHNAGKKKK